MSTFFLENFLICASGNKVNDSAEETSPKAGQALLFFLLEQKESKIQGHAAAGEWYKSIREQALTKVLMVNVIKIRRRSREGKGKANRL